MSEIKVAYAQFCGRVLENKANAIHLTATAIYSNKELTKLINMSVCEMRNYEENKEDKYDVYRNRFGEYAAALRFIYDQQDALKAQGYTAVILCPSSRQIWNWISGTKPVPTPVKELYNNICRQFRHTGDMPITLSIGLSIGPTAKKAYKYCQEQYLNAKICKLRRGAHILTDEEIVALQTAKQNKDKELEDSMLAEAVSVYDILQPAAGDMFEPTIKFGGSD